MREGITLTNCDVARRRRSGRADTMIALFTDFGLHGPYTGQMKAALPRSATQHNLVFMILISFVFCVVVFESLFRWPNEDLPQHEAFRR